MVARAACYSSGSTRRSCFVCARCCLPSRRRARLPAVGRVSTRLGSTWSASSINRSSRSSAAWRLAACDRRSPARTTIASSTIRARSRPRTCCSSAAVRLSSASGSRNSMRVCERLRCWPPGPDPVVARNSARSTGMYLPSARCIRPLEHTWRRVARLCGYRVALSVACEQYDPSSAGRIVPATICGDSEQTLALRSMSSESPSRLVERMPPA